MHKSAREGDSEGPIIGLNLEKGISLVSLVLALLILGLLYVGYDNLRHSEPPLVKAAAVGLQTSNAAACQLNCKEIERALLTWSVTHPGQEATLESLRQAGFHVPSCPDGGQLQLRGQAVTCSLHSP